MNRESRQARTDREARKAALPAAPAAPVDPFADFPKRPWTPARIAYTILLWLVWNAIAAAMILMSWHAGDRRFSVLLQPAPDMDGVTLLYWIGIAALVVIPIRVVVDNPRASFIPILLGVWGALIFGFEWRDNLHGLDRNVIVHHVYQKQVVVRKLSRRGGGRNTSPYTVYDVDNPAHAGRLITFPPAVMSASVGDVFCVDVVVGQFGGVWALPPEYCKKKELAGDF